MKNCLDAFRLKFEDEFLVFASAQIREDGAMFEAIKNHITELVRSKQQIQLDRIAAQKAHMAETEAEENGAAEQPQRSILGEAVEQHICSALALDFGMMPRPSRYGDGSYIEIHNRKQIN